jgi:hypothetical protein
MLAISIPKVRQQKLRSAEVRPRRVESWLADLPRANPSETAQQLCQALFAQNRIPLTAANRASLMDLYQEPLTGVIASLERDTGAATYPLALRNQAMFDLAQRLLAEVANSYKIIATDLATQNKIETARAELVMAIQRAILYLGRRLLNVYQVYHPCPSGLWRDLHQLYHFAEQQSLLEDTVAVPELNPGSDGTSSINDTYRRVALVGACNPYGLLQGEVSRLYDLIPLWRADAEIMQQPKGKDAAGSFLINLAADAPPVPMVKTPRDQGKAGEWRYMSTIGLVREIHRILKNLGNSAALKALNAGLVPGVDVTQPDLLHRAGRMLGALSVRRRSKRSRADMELVICTGVNAIHYFASGQRPFAEPANASRPSFHGKDHDDGDEAQEEQYLDLMDPNVDIHLGESGHAGLARKGDGKGQTRWQHNTVYRLHPCQARDQSASGLCLRFSIANDLKLRVGDPVGLQYPTPDRWRVAVVRWLRTDASDKLDIGVQLLAPELDPVAVRRQPAGDEDDPPYFQALLLPGNVTLRQPGSLLLPRGSYKNHDRLEMRRGDADPEQVVLLRLLDRTGSYDQLLLTSPGG